MTAHRPTPRLATAAATLLWVAGLTSLAAAPHAAAQAGNEALIGTFRVAAGSCTGSSVSGSVFRMVVPSGGPNGPYVSNNDSTCSDHTYTSLTPGTDGGLETGTFQSEPNPAFDGGGNSLAARITKPALFYGIAFSTSTNAVDPQTGVHVPAPSLSVQGGKLTGDVRAFAASWNRQEFNQGAPKPDGSAPGNTAAPTGTYNASTGAFVLDWASQIQGGPFNNFTGYWHLEGKFVATHATTATTAAPARSSQGTSTPVPTTRPPTAAPSGGATAFGATPAAPVVVPTTAPVPPPTDTGTGSAFAPLTGPAQTSQAAASIGNPAGHRRTDVVPVGVLAAILAAAAAAGTGWYGLVRRRATT